MKTFRQHVKEIKFWMIWAWAGVAVMVITYVPFLTIMILDMSMGISVQLSDWYAEFLIHMILFAPAISGGLFVIAGSGIGRRKTCSKCGHNFTVKELEAMGDKFFCPYCLNETFNDY